MTASWKIELRQLVALAMPLLTAHLLTTGIGAVDTLMAGRYHANDLAAIAVGNSIWLPLSLLISGLLIASTSMVARYHGASEHRDIVATVQQSFWLALAVAVACIVVLLNAHVVLAWIAVDADFAPIVERYLHAIAFGFPAFALLSTQRSFTEAMGKTKPFMMSSLFGFVVNIPLNYALIYGAWGLPELGGEGCGWATAASMWLQCLALFLFTRRHQDYANIRIYHRWQRPDWSYMCRIARLGLPISLAVFAEVSIFSAIALLLAPLGAQVVAGHQIALSVSHLVFMLPLSLSQALTIRVALFLGKGDQSAANFVVRVGLFVALSLALVTSVMIFLGREFLVGLYTLDEAVRQVALVLFFWMALYQLPDQLQISANACLRAYQDTRKPLGLILLSYWGLALPLGYIVARTEWLGEALAAEGFWIGLLVGLTATAVLLGSRLWHVARQPI